MKTRSFIAAVALVAAVFAAAPAARAESASGSYQFSFDDGRSKYVEFDARGESGGGATGRMFFSDDAPVTYEDTDGVGDPVETYNGFYMSAEFDQMLVDGGRAVISGTVRDSNIRGLIGRRLLLTVEDNGDNTREPDRLTWGVYENAPRGWTASDAELEHDPGVGLSWTAYDAERRDDQGIPMPANGSIDARTFPLASFEYAAVERGGGDIVVQP